MGTSSGTRRSFFRWNSLVSNISWDCPFTANGHTWIDGYWARRVHQLVKNSLTQLRTVLTVSTGSTYSYREAKSMTIKYQASRMYPYFLQQSIFKLNMYKNMYMEVKFWAKNLLLLMWCCDVLSMFVLSKRQFWILWTFWTLLTHISARTFLLIFVIWSKKV